MTSPTSRAISRLGIGSYRLALGVPEHERILYRALERQKDPRLNINLIDTSSNYSNGRSEQLIGKVLSNPRHNTLRRDEIVIATKFGYIQNENMRLLSEGVFQRVPPEEIVEYSRECYHSIHPEFMRDQLTRSLERLNTKYVDILFVHNPEYFLMTNVKGTEDNVKKHQTILLNRLAILFEELEREIEKGRIRAYGISSNSFSLKPSHAHFLPYQDLVKMATSAFDRMRIQREQEHALFLEQQQQQQPSGGVSSGGSRSGGKVFPPSNSNSFSTSTTTKTTPLSPSQHKPGQGQGQGSTSEKRASQPTPPKLVNRTTHGLGYLQMPGNLLETEGLNTTAKWAKTKNLSVFINRPLNAMSPEFGPARLASYPPPLAPTYAEAMDEVLGALVALGKQREYLQPKMGRLREMIEGLDESLRTNKLSIIQMEGASVRNQLHQELAKPVPVPSKTKGSGIASSSTASPSLSPAAAAAVEAFKTSPTSTKPATAAATAAHQPSTKPPTSSSSTTTMPPPSTTTHHGAPGKVTEHELDHFIKSLDHFIHAFHQQVRFQETTRIRKIMTERGVNLKEEPIEQFAVEYLLEHDQVDAILLGMKREPYVDFARGVLKSLVVAPHPPSPSP
ncbi:NADP-dependent oxidoreductase domain-containing protein [Linnemannia elongata]|nr:NADP-dependent oxidoreductase domain-containing protein [Linnemannia elongata]